MKLDEGQSIARDCLAANATFTGIDIFVELDADATLAELKDYDRRFETALLTTGLAVIVMLPHALKLGESRAVGGKTAGGILLDIVYPIALCENEEVNRGTADATATPPRTPAGVLPLTLQRAAIAALLGKFTFPAQPLARPEFGDGFMLYPLYAQRSDLIVASP